MRRQEYNHGEWDEHRCERYLREHDSRADQYIQLLEEHLTDPNREQIIARRMGWEHLLEGHEGSDIHTRACLFFEEIEQLMEGEDDEAFGDLDEDACGTAFENGFSDYTEDDEEEGYGAEFAGDDESDEAVFGNYGELFEGDTQFRQDVFFDLSNPDGADDHELSPEDFEDDLDDDFTTHPLCDLAITYHAWLERLFIEEPALLEEPEAIRLAAYSAICCSKLNSGLDGNEFEDLGMSIAYLKRAVKATNMSLNACAGLEGRQLLPKRRVKDLRSRIFRIRDGIVELMGFYRSEWLRRASNGGEE